MSRKYRVTFEGVSVSGPQDLVQINGASGKMVRITRYWVGAINLATAQMIEVRCRYLPATVTNGSGGSTTTPQKLDQGDASSSSTAFVNNTTKATTVGTPVIQDEDSFHVYAGFDKSVMNPFTVSGSTSWVFEMLSSPSGALSLSGGVEIEEIG